MTDGKNYRGTFIGIVFTIVSLLLTLTYIAPIVSVLPGALLEAIASRLIANEPYSDVGRLTFLLLTVVLLLALSLSLYCIRKTASRSYVSNRRIVLVMCLCYFIVHPLGFYCYWGLKLDFRSDGQLILGAANSFPVSSFAFVVIGLLIDVVKNPAANTRIAALHAKSYL